jgi:hypothetical protein
MDIHKPFSSRRAGVTITFLSFSLVTVIVVMMMAMITMYNTASIRQ